MNESWQQKSLDDPLGQAYRSLQGDDPQVQNAKEHLWRRIWARDSVAAWIDSGSNMPALFKSLHRALPQDDIGLLEEIKLVAAKHDNSVPAFFIIGLANERIERCNSAMLEKVRRQTSCAIPDPVSDSFGAFKLTQSSNTKRENYNGYVCAAVKSVGGDWLTGTPNLPITSTPLALGTYCRLTIWMQPERPEGVSAEEILIETGFDEDIVTFGIEVDCATLHFPYGRKGLRFHRRRKSGTVEFDFNTLRKATEHLVFVHVFQGTTLTKSLMIILRTAASQDGSTSHRD
jgi:hypothetical protein